MMIIKELKKLIFLLTPLISDYVFSESGYNIDMDPPEIFRQLEKE